MAAGTSGDSCSLIVYQERDGKECYSNGCLTNKKFFVKVENLKTDGELYNGAIHVRIDGSTGPTTNRKAAVVDGKSTEVAAVTWAWVGATDFDITVRIEEDGKKGRQIVSCASSFSTSDTCSGEDSCSATPVAANSDSKPFELCNQVTSDEQKSECLACLDSSPSGIWTAIGCIPTEAEGIVATFIKVGLSIGGGVTLLLILAGSFQLSISQGDPKKTTEAREQITSAVIGLIFIILSVTILQFIGVTLFKIPGFGG